MDEVIGVLKVKDEDGNWHTIAGLKGDSAIIATDDNNDGNVVISFSA